MRLSDPGLAALRRGARVAIVAPLVFGWYLEVVDLPIAAMFGAFGAFAMLGFADFGGEPWPRTRAYLALTLVGAALALLGTALNPHPVAAALVAVLVASGVRFVGCFGGYFQASVSPLILAFVLGATVPESGGGLGGRALGWITAGALAMIAALVLWPRRERRVLQELVADTAAAARDGVREVASSGRVTPARATALRDALGTMEAALAQPRRPAGPNAHDVAFAYLVDQVRRIATLVLRTETAPVVHRGVLTGLGDAAAGALDAAARSLRAGRPAEDLTASVHECVLQREAVVEAAARRIMAGEDATAVIDAVDDAFVVRLTAFLAASLATNVGTLLGGTVPADDSIGTGRFAIPLEVPGGGGLGGAVRRLRTLIATHLVPTSTWAQESLRAGLAVGAAVLIALEADLDHGFWVVLGTLSVLRSNAFSTGRSALDSALGTAIGFAISSGLLALVGFDRAGLWVLVIVGFFLAAYTPQVVGFVAGQACFTVLVVALFNLIEPEGWRTGLVRFEDIAIGVAVSAVVALLFWPRRAVHELRATVAALYDTLGGALGPAFGGAPDSAPILRAERRAHAAYEGYLSERLGAPPGQRPWANLLATASQGRGAIVALERHPDLAHLESDDPVGEVLVSEARSVGRALIAVGSAVAHPGAAAAAGAAADLDADAVASHTKGAVGACLTAHARDAELDAALDAAFARDWLVALAALLPSSRAAVAQTG